MRNIHKCGVVVLGKYNRVLMFDDSIQMNKIVGQKKISKTNLLSHRSNLFFEPTYIKYILHRLGKSEDICDGYIPIVGEKTKEKILFKIGKDNVEVIPFNEQIFSVIIFPSKGRAQKGYTFAFCKLKESNK